MNQLAINGGTPIVSGGYSTGPWPPVNEKTAERLKEIYLSQKWSFNSEAEQAFERAFAERHNAKHGIFMANGTVTLECALEALGIGPGDEVVVPAMTWMATAMAVRYVGATPVFADMEPDTLGLDPAAFEAAITPRTRAVIPVHLYGSMADLERILVIAEKRGIAVVEDCAHMQGGMWKGRAVGSWGAIGSFSFQQSKTLTSGEGGICITNDDDLADLLYRCKHIGYSRRDKQGQAATPPPAGLLCHNYRGTAFQAQILHDQLEGLNDLLWNYGEFAGKLAEAVKGIPGVRLQQQGRLATFQGYYGIGIFFDGAEWEGIPIGKITHALIAEGARALNGNYGPVYKHMLFNLRPGEFRMPEGGCPVCDRLCPRYLIVMHYGMTYPENAEKLAAMIRKLFENRKELTC